MEVTYFIHMHWREKALAFGRRYGDVREVMFQEAYPERDQAEAWEWFHLCVDAIAHSSRCEWWCLSDVWPDVDTEFPGCRSKLVEAVQEAFGVPTSADGLPVTCVSYRRGQGGL